MRKLILIWTYILVFLVSTTCLFALENDLVSQTESTDNYKNNDGTYTKILYSGIRNVFEDGKWKRVEDARSLKDKGFKILYLEIDPDLIIEIIDFNYSAITYKAKVKNKYVNEDMPIRVFKQNMTFDELKWGQKYPNQKITWKDKVIKQSEKNYKFLSEFDEVTETVPFGLSYYLEFGKNSTVVILQDVDTENIGDTWTQESDNPSYNSGADTAIKTDRRRDWRAYIKFSLVQIPINVTIHEAYLHMYPPSTASETVVNAYHVINHTWREGNGTGTECSNELDCNGGIIHNRQPCGAGFNDSQQCNLTPEVNLSITEAGQWYKFNITGMVISEYSSNFNNVSIVLRDKLTNPNEGAVQVYFNSKENADTTKRPYLNITYTRSLSVYPSATGVRVLPQNPNAGQDLLCNYTYTSPKNYTEQNSSFKWFKNGTDQNINAQLLSKTNLTRPRVLMF